MSEDNSYFDAYDLDKIDNYYRILYKPGLAVISTEYKPPIQTEEQIREIGELLKVSEKSDK